MILLCGIPTEPPLEMVAEELERRGEPTLVFNQRKFLEYDMALEIGPDGVDGFLLLEGERVRLRDIRGVYLRLMDDRQLPELTDVGENDPRRRHCRALHDMLLRWSEIADGHIINRPMPMGSNMSKPYQALLIQSCGIDVPATLITDDPQSVIAFRQQHERIIYKSMSGVRSIVREFVDGDEDRLSSLRTCPTQFQQYIDGINVRVHTIGERAFSTSIVSNSTDYRYPDDEDVSTELVPFDLPRQWEERCILLAKHLGLDFAGIDLKITSEGHVYCFEVNPCPVYSYYERGAGQPIAAAVADHLAGDHGS